jgi:hypothetical protein
MADAEGDRPMRSFLVECYTSGIERGSVAAAGTRLSRAAEELRRDGQPIEYVRALAVPGDEVAFHLFLAAEAAVVREAARRAGVTCERIVESIVVEAESTATPVPTSTPTPFPAD